MTTAVQTQFVRGQVFQAPSGRLVQFTGLRKVGDGTDERALYFEYLPDDVPGAAYLMRDRLMLSQANQHLLKVPGARR